MTFTQAALLTSWLAIVLLTLGMAGLLRQVNQLGKAMALRESGHGAAVTSAELSGLALPRSGLLSELLPSDRPVLAIFVSPGCRSCAAVLADVSERLAGAPQGVVGPEVVVVSSGPCPTSPLPPGARCVPDAMEILDRLSIPGAPYVMSVAFDGTIGAGSLVAKPEDLPPLFDTPAADRTRSPERASEQIVKETA